MGGQKVYHVGDAEGRDPRSFHSPKIDTFSAAPAVRFSKYPHSWKEKFMKKLVDYSGPFFPHLKLEDFSKEALISLIKVYSRLYMGLDGFWYLSVKEHFGNDEALKCDEWVWEKDHRFELKHLASLFKIEGNGIIPFLKAFQLTPWVWNLDFTFELNGPEQAVLTVHRCPTLVSLEKEGHGRERSICQIIEPKVFQNYATFFSPKIRITPMKLAPRKDQNEVPCQWKVMMTE